MGSSKGGRHVEACPIALAQWVDDTVGGEEKRRIALRQAGIGRQTFHNWLCGRNLPSPGLFKKLLPQLGKYITWESTKPDEQLEQVETLVGQRHQWWLCCKANPKQPCPYGEQTSSEESEQQSSTAARLEFERPDWPTAVDDLSNILRLGPSAFIEALGGELGLTEIPREAGAKRVAQQIDALGTGPDIAETLLRMCTRAIRQVKQRAPEHRRTAVQTAARLARTWLPRRYWRDHRIWRVVGRTSPYDKGYCDDLEVETRDSLMIDIHVSCADGVPSYVELIRRPPSEDGPEFDFRGARRLPQAEAALAEMKSAAEVSESITAGYASMFRMGPGQSRTRTMRSYLVSQRDMGDPRYLLAEGRSTSDRLLAEIKKTFPPLRIVTTTSVVDQFEADILPKLQVLLVEADEPSSTKA